MILYGARLLVRIDPKTLKGTVEPISSIPFNPIIASGEGEIVGGLPIPPYIGSGSLPYGSRLISGDVVSVGQRPKQTQAFSDHRPEFEDDEKDSFDPNPLPDQISRLLEIGTRLISGQNIDVQLDVCKGDRVVFNIQSADRWPEGDSLFVVNNYAVIGKLDAPSSDS